MVTHPKRNTHPGTERKRRVSFHIEEYKRRAWLTPETGAEARDQQIARDIEQDVGHEAVCETIKAVSMFRALWITQGAEAFNHLQNGESNVVLVTDQPKVLPHSIDGSIGYVDPIQESKEVNQADDGDDPEINLPDQGRLVDI